MSLVPLKKEIIPQYLSSYEIWQSLIPGSGKNYHYKKIQQIILELKKCGKIKNSYRKLSQGRTLELFYFDNYVKSLILDEIKRLGLKKTRVHYEIPRYRKVYSAYQYDWVKYAHIYKKLQVLAIKYGDKNIFWRVNPYNILKLCYLKDKNGKLRKTEETKHIFRYKTLQRILEEIGRILTEKYKIIQNNECLRYLTLKTNIALYFDDKEKPQGELLDYFDKEISIRMKANINLLRHLKKGIDVEIAVSWTKDFMKKA